MADLSQALSTHYLCSSSQQPGEEGRCVGTQGDLSNLPKVTKFMNAAEPQANPVPKGPEPGPLVTVFHRLHHRLRTLGRSSASPSLAQDLNEQIRQRMEQQG